MNIYIESHGCSRRKLDVSKFHRYFSLNGYTIVEDPAKADILLITTCAFKYDEEEESIKAIDNLGRYNKKVIVYGCLPTIAPTKYNCKFDYINIAPKDINEIDKYFEGITIKFSQIDDANVIESEVNYSPLPVAIKKFTNEFELSLPFIVKSGRYVKNKFFNTQQNFHISTSRGCLGNCSYCGVRFAVGTLKSKPLATVLNEFSKGVECGYKNFSVLGDDVGGYGQDCCSNLCELISALLDEMDKKPNNNFNIHLEEINPRWVIQYGDELTSLLSSKNIKSILCPIQSGSNRILGLMNRNDDIDKLMVILNEIHKKNKKLELNTQIIVGFPTETEPEFEESLRQLSKVQFSSVTLFPYDDKEKTESYEIHPKVPESVKQERIKKAQIYLRQKGIKSALCCNE
ncbi:MAG: hypothetical protein A2X83_02770 [Desulfuromonadales bacterium GWD2_54_10]|nr:MAG: hypothetical protein A2X83_02770 [Desulfuromonadales bacterium GWD2_54_10]